MDRIIQDSDNSDAEDEPLVAAPVDCDIISTIRTAPNSSESVNNAYNVPGLIDCEKTPGVRATNSSGGLCLDYVQRLVLIFLLGHCRKNYAATTRDCSSCPI